MYIHTYTYIYINKIKWAQYKPTKLMATDAPKQGCD